MWDVLAPLSNEACPINMSGSKKKDKKNKDGKEAPPLPSVDPNLGIISPGKGTHTRSRSAEAARRGEHKSGSTSPARSPTAVIPPGNAGGVGGDRNNNGSGNKNDDDDPIDNVTIPPVTTMSAPVKSEQPTLNYEVTRTSAALSAAPGVPSHSSLISALAANAAQLGTAQTNGLGNSVVSTLLKWEEGEYASAWGGMTAFGTGTKDSSNYRTDLLRAAKLPAPSCASIASLKLPTFGGDAALYPAWSAAVLGIARSNKMAKYLLTSHYDVLEAAASLVNDRSLPFTFGGEEDDDTTHKPGLPRRKQFANAAIQEVKEICQSIYNLLINAIREEQHVNLTVRTQIADLPERSDDVWAEGDMQFAADPHALWKMLEQTYTTIDVGLVANLQSQLMRTTCSGNTKAEVQAFYTEIRRLREELRGVSGVDQQTIDAFDTFASQRGRNGLTPELLMKVREQELRGAIQPAKLPAMVAQIATILDEGAASIHALSINAVRPAPSHLSKGAIRPPPSHKEKGTYCEFHWQRDGTTPPHGTNECYNRPQGWKAGDECPPAANNQRKRSPSGEKKKSGGGRGDGKMMEMFKAMMEQQQKNIEQQNKHNAEMIKQLSNSKSSPSSYPSFNSIDYFDHSLVTRDDDGTEVIVLNGVCSIDTNRRRRSPLIM